MSLTDKDEHSGHFHCLFRDSSISALELFQGSGLSVHRLRTQLRMAEGMFDIASKAMYPEIPLYAPSCRIDLTCFELGCLPKRFMRGRHPGASGRPHQANSSPCFSAFPGPGCT